MCTENLTPWARLLPCRGAAGLASLLHGPTVFSSPFTSLTASLTAARAADGPAGGTRLRLAQTLTLLLRAEGPRGGWSLGGLFGGGARGACPLAAPSAVRVQLPWDASAGLPGSSTQAAERLGASPAPAEISVGSGTVILQYPLPPVSAQAPLRISCDPRPPQSTAAADAPALTVHRCVM